MEEGGSGLIIKDVKITIFSRNINAQARLSWGSVHTETVSLQRLIESALLNIFEINWISLQE